MFVSGCLFRVLVCLLGAFFTGHVATRNSNVGWKIFLDSLEKVFSRGISSLRFALSFFKSDFANIDIVTLFRGSSLKVI